MSVLRILPFFLILCLSSCAGSIRILSQGCTKGDAQFTSENIDFQPNHTWQRKVWTFGGGKDDAQILNLKELLAEKDIDCKKINFVRYQIGQSFWDQIFSVFPMTQRMTLTVELMSEA